MSFDPRGAEVAKPGSQLLYPAAAALEQALADVEGEHLLGINAELVIENWDPWKVLPRNLPYLAWAMGVTLWDEDWSEEKKRSWVAAQWEFKARRGTLRAFEMALDVMSEPGRELGLIQVVTQPQGMHLAGGPSKAELDAYYALLPEIRVYFARLRDRDDGGVWLGESFLDDRFLPADRGEVLYGRRGTLFRPGAEIPLKTYRLETRIVENHAVDFERVAIPGKAGAGLMLDADFCDAAYLDGNEERARLVTYELDRAYDHFESDFSITYVTPGLDPITPRYERGSLVGDAGWSLMLDGDFLGGRSYLVPDNALDLIFDRLRLFDPEVDAPLGTVGDFLDDARIGMPAYTAEMIVSAPRRAPVSELMCDQGFVGYDFLAPDNLTLVERAFRALTAAMALRDTLLVTFETTRPLQFGDRPLLDGSKTFSSRAPFRL